MRSRGLARRTAGLHEGAVEDLSAALLANPADESALHARGFAHRKLGNYSEAAADYTALIALGKPGVRTFNSRG